MLRNARHLMARGCLEVMVRGWTKTTEPPNVDCLLRIRSLRAGSS